ncbi:S66 peptidase family protein [Actinoplanes philippinensis]|uniref:S66 peptidase family protein n=1 Tax=Actinoplanes philippinensis TaxID=35752 RepID=UPI0033E9DEE0
MALGSARTTPAGDGRDSASSSGTAEPVAGPPHVAGSPGSAAAPGRKPPRLQAGDRVRIVSPSSPPNRDHTAAGVEVLTSWGLQVEVGQHVFDQWGFMAGRDEDRIADLNDAVRDPGVRAIFATRGGKGAYRIVDDIDTEALHADPKPIVGFSDTTHMLLLWARTGITALHGPMINWSSEWCGPASEEALRAALMTTDDVVLHVDANEASAAVTVDGTASGVLLGGNLDAVRTEAGAGIPNLHGAILFLEHQRGTGIGEVDRALTQLMRTGALNSIAGIVLGCFVNFEQDLEDETLGGWGVIDVLRDRLGRLGVPVLGGIPAGHRSHPPTIPLSTHATIDTRLGTLTVEAAVC